MLRALLCFCDGSDVAQAAPDHNLDLAWKSLEDLTIRSGGHVVDHFGRDWIPRVQLREQLRGVRFGLGTNDIDRNPLNN
jgi:hypothetical protein